MLYKGYNKLFSIPRFLTSHSFGLDVSDESLKFLELVPTHKGMKLGSFGEISIPSGIIKSGKIEKKEELKKIILDLKKEQNIKSVRVSLPEEQVYLFKLDLPKEGGSNPREMIELSLQEYVPIPPDDIIFDFEMLKENETSFEVEIAAVPKSVIEDYVEVFQDCDLNINSLELEAQALANAIIKNGDKNTYMTVDFGNHRTGISIVSQGVAVFTSTIDIGGFMLTNLIEKNFKISFEEAEKLKLQYGLVRNKENQEVFSTILNGVSILRDEISKHFVYWHTTKDEDGKEREKIRKIILCGRGSNLKGLKDYIAIGMRHPVELAEVWANVQLAENYVPEMSFRDSLSYATALGLALGDFNYD
jgi:type IV pilus assembly protein PilM